MKFEIKNLGLVDSANIDINKINVVSGKNSVIKSNISKIIYCFLAPASKEHDKITEYRIYKELLGLIVQYELSGKNRLLECHELLYNDENKKCLELFRETIENETDKDKFIINELNRIEKIYYENEEEYTENLDFLINDEYCYPYELLRNSKITIETDTKNILVEENGNIINTLEDLNLENFFYMSINQTKDYYHNTHIRNKLYEELNEIGIEEAKILNKISEIIDNYNSCEIPFGLMQINKIKRLISQGKLKKDSYLLIDNPENDLHPIIQVKVAEILVLISLKLNIHLYINTNSPFLTEAIETYSKFYNIHKETNFYHVEKDEVTGKYNLVLLDDLSIKKIYDEYDEAFEIIKNIRSKIKLGLNEGYF